MTENEIPSHTQDLIEINNLLAGNADIRLVTLLGVGYLENYVQDLIILRLPNFDGKRHRELIRGPLRSVSSRVKLGEALGAIAPSVADELMTLVKIRNRFAHNVQATSVDDPEVQKHIMNLTLTQNALTELSAEFEDWSKSEFLLRQSIQGVVTGLHDLVENPYV